MRLCLLKHGIVIYNNKLQQFVNFHIECWKEIGGEEYMFALPEEVK